MERLSITLLLLLFVLSGSGLTLTAMVAYLFLGLSSLDHTTLLAMFSLLTYHFYGLFGMMYVAFSNVFLIICGLMYWFGFSFDDLRKRCAILQGYTTPSSESSTSTKSSTVTEPSTKSDSVLQENESVESADSTSTSNVSSDIQCKLTQLQDYKNTLFSQFYQKTGLTDDKIALIKEYCVLASTKFDNLTDLLFIYVARLKELTKDVVGLKTIYSVYDKLLGFVSMLEQLKTFSSMARTMNGMNDMNNMFNNIPTGIPRHQSTPEISTSEILGVSNDNLSEEHDPLAVPMSLTEMKRSWSNMTSDRIKQLDDEMTLLEGNMSPEQKKQIDDMTIKLMNEFMGSLGPMDLSNIPKKSNSRR